MKKTNIYAWYFPNWHSDPRNDEWHGKGWTEWEVTKCARPRFENHEQPKIPLWGYENESDPSVMEKKISVALSHGIDGFLWDIYYFEDGGYRFDALDKGFFGADNNEKFEIALMWCNHDPVYAHPATRLRPNDPLLSGDVSENTFIKLTNMMIEKYFWRKNYIRFNGKIFFVIWDYIRLINNFGGLEEAKRVLEDFRERVRKAGLGELCLGAVVTNIPSYHKREKEEFNELLDDLGIDECLRYGWEKNLSKFPAEPYEDFVERGCQTFLRDTNFSDKPMNITVCSGWDSSPRTVQSDMYENVGSPWLTVTTDNTPEKFQHALEEARNFAYSDKFTGHFVSISCFNEWTEGSYIEPDTKYGYGMLEAVRTAFEDSDT